MLELENLFRGISTSVRTSEYRCQHNLERDDYAQMLLLELMDVSEH
jgi:hypothetical protein